MTKLASAIKFRSLANRLNDQEFQRFIDQSLQKYGRTFLLAPLFRDFVGCEAREANQDMLNGAISIIEDIIKSREKPSDSDAVPSTILSLSHALIGEIGSFCNQKYHSNFSICCRTTFIGCNAPNTLRELDLLKCSNYHLVDIPSFSQIRSLRFKLKDFFYLSLPTENVICRHLHKMQIDCYWDLHIRADIHELTRCTAFRFENISHLALTGFGVGTTNNVCYFSENAFVALLQRFSNLRNLYLSAVTVSTIGRETLSNLRKSLPNLDTFVFSQTDTIFTRQLISTFSQTMRALHCAWLKVGEILPSLNCIDFPVLEELTLHASPGIGSVLQTIGKSSHGLERLCLNWRPKRCDPADAAAVLPALLCDQKGLRQLVIRANTSQIESIFPSIERAIYNVSNEERDSIQIKLRMRCDIKVEADDVMYHFLRIVNQLQVSKFNDYLLLWRFRKVKHIQIDHRAWKQRLQKVKEQIHDRSEMTFSSKDIVVSNKKCKLPGLIRGYLTDDWLSGPPF